MAAVSCVCLSGAACQQARVEVAENELAALNSVPEQSRLTCLKTLDWEVVAFEKNIAESGTFEKLHFQTEKCVIAKHNFHQVSLAVRNSFQPIFTNEVGLDSNF